MKISFLSVLLPVKIGVVLVVIFIFGCSSVRDYKTSNFERVNTDYSLSVKNIDIIVSGINSRKNLNDDIKSAVYKKLPQNYENKYRKKYKIDTLNVDYYVTRDGFAKSFIFGAMSILPIPPFILLRNDIVLTYKVYYEITGEEAKDRIFGKVENTTHGSYGGQLFFRGAFSGKVYRRLLNQSIECLANDLLLDIEKNIEEKEGSG